MTDLIDQLFTIAINEEFSPEQRKELMQIALDDAGETNRLFPLRCVDGSLWPPRPETTETKHG